MIWSAEKQCVRLEGAVCPTRVMAGGMHERASEYGKQVDPRVRALRAVRAPCSSVLHRLATATLWTCQPIRSFYTASTFLKFSAHLASHRYSSPLFPAHVSSPVKTL